MEEEEEITVLAEELAIYFFFPSTGSASFPISKHLEAVHEHFSGSFLMNLAVFAQLQKSLLRVAKLIDSLVAPEVKEACQHLAIKLKTLTFNYRVYEECRSSSLKNLNQLLELWADNFPMRVLVVSVFPIILKALIHNR